MRKQSRPNSRYKSELDHCVASQDLHFSMMGVIMHTHARPFDHVLYIYMGAVSLVSVPTNMQPTKLYHCSVNINYGAIDSLLNSIMNATCHGMQSAACSRSSVAELLLRSRAARRELRPWQIFSIGPSVCFAAMSYLHILQKSMVKRSLQLISELVSRLSFPITLTATIPILLLYI